MTQEILEALTKSLPAMQMDALRVELEKAKNCEAMRAELSKFQALYNDTQKQVYEKEREITALESKLKPQREFEDAKFKLDLTLAKKDTDCAIAIAKEIKELAMAGFKNPTVMKSTTIAVPGGGNYSGHTVPITERTGIE